MERVIEAMRLSEKESQMLNCLGLIQYIRTRKAVAIVGEVASGKTQVLKMAA